MPVDAHGYEAITVIELIEGLTRIVADNPFVSNDPVHIDGGSMYLPVKRITFTPAPRGQLGNRVILRPHFG